MDRIEARETAQQGRKSASSTVGNSGSSAARGSEDEQSARAVLEQMLKLVAETDTALMVVTHSQNVAAKMDKQIQLVGGKLT